MEVKPTRELEQEIERFGMAKIKWHTPFDYSLDKQVVRYDFLGSDLPRELAEEKSTSFFSALSKRYRRKFPAAAIEFANSVNLEGGAWPYAVVKDSKVHCVIRLSSERSEFPDDVLLGENVTIRKLGFDTNYAQYDVTEAFNTSINYPDQEQCLPMLKDADGGRIKEFLDLYIFLPVLNRDAKFKDMDNHKVVDLSFKHLIRTIGGL